MRKCKMELVFRVFFSGFRLGDIWRSLEDKLNFPRLSYSEFPVGGHRIPRDGL